MQTLQILEIPSCLFHVIAKCQSARFFCAPDRYTDRVKFPSHEIQHQTRAVCPLLLKPLKHPKQFLGMITYKRGMKCHEFIVNVNQKTNASHFHSTYGSFLKQYAPFSVNQALICQHFVTFPTHSMKQAFIIINTPINGEWSTQYPLQCPYFKYSQYFIRVVQVSSTLKSGLSSTPESGLSQTIFSIK